MKRKRILSVLIAVSMILSMTLSTSHMTAAEIRETWISDEYLSHVNEICEEYRICPELVIAIIEHESSGEAGAVNGDCKGLMQINEPYHLERMKRLGVTDLSNPYQNIMVGVDYLSELAAEYDDLYTVLMVYNGTKDAIERGENCNWTDYAKGIVKRSVELERLHGK